MGKRTWVPGSQLRAADKSHALRLFNHRRLADPSSDQEWLANHYFALRRDGGLDLGVRKYRTLRDVLEEVRPCN